MSDSALPSPAGPPQSDFGAGATIATNLVFLALTILISWMVWKQFAKRYPASQRYSTFWPRFWESSVDSLVFWPLNFLVMLINLYCKVLPVLAAAAILQDTLWWVYSIWMHGKYGQTLGKMSTRVRILDAATEQPITYRQALLRDLVPIILVALSLPSEINSIYHAEPGAQIQAFTWITSINLLWFAIEVVTMLSNKRRRALHDFIAGTIVVRTNAGDTEDGLLREPPAAPDFETQPSLA